MCSCNNITPSGNLDDKEFLLSLTALCGVYAINEVSTAQCLCFVPSFLSLSHQSRTCQLCLNLLPPVFTCYLFDLFIIEHSVGVQNVSVYQLIWLTVDGFQQLCLNNFCLHHPAGSRQLPSPAEVLLHEHALNWQLNEEVQSVEHEKGWLTLNLYKDKRA